MAPPESQVSEAVIVAAIRTPVGRRNGFLACVHPVDLAAMVLQQVLRQVGLSPSDVDEVILGCVLQAGEQALNVARNAVLQAGFPVSVPALTVDRQCGSGEEAIHIAADRIEAGACDSVIAGGIESMTRVPLGSTWKNGPGDPYPVSLRARYALVHQGTAADMIAERWGVSRREADELALRSHRLAQDATDDGRFAREIAPVPTTKDGQQVVVDRDEGIRVSTDLKQLAALQPAFGPNGVHTAGNSSQLSDGAAAVLLMSAARARALGLRPRARLPVRVAVGVDPVLMLTGPIPATRRALQRAGMTMAQIDLFEVNEAFASVVGAWQRELQPDMSRVNVNGGAIALGHPLGASGARLMVTLLHELERRDARVGLQTMCCAGGLGTATIIDRRMGGQVL